MAVEFEIRQINQGYSKKINTLRGLHYQEGIYAQAKMISYLADGLYSIALDVNPDSSTYKQWHGEILSFENKKIMYIPRGFAHGYVSLEEDLEIGMDWHIDLISIIISDKDKNAKFLNEINMSEDYL